MWWVYLSIACTFIVLVAKLHPAITVAECLAGAIPVGLAASAWLAFVVSGLLSGLSHSSILLTTALSLAYTATQLPDFLNAIATVKWKSPAERGLLPYLAILLVPVTGLGVYLWDTRYIPQNSQGGWDSGGSVWADFPIHLTFANSFLHGENRGVWFTNLKSPIFAEAPMHYPFIPDFHMAAVEASGSTMREGAWITGAMLFSALAANMLFLTNRLTHNPIAGLLSVLFIIGAGGIGGFGIVYKDGFGGIIWGDPIQDSGDGKGDVWWFGFLNHVLLPQRGATWAYPLCIFVLQVMWVACRSIGHGRRDQRLLCTAALLCGLVPLIQAHSFVFLAVCIGTLFLFELPHLLFSWLWRRLLVWLKAAAVVLAVAVPQLLLFRTQVSHAGGGQSFLVLGPLFNGGIWGFITTWAKGLGPTVFLFFGVVVVELLSTVRQVLRAGGVKGLLQASVAEALEFEGHKMRLVNRMRREIETADALPSPSSGDSATAPIMEEILSSHGYDALRYRNAAAPSPRWYDEESPTGSSLSTGSVWEDGPSRVTELERIQSLRHFQDKTLTWNPELYRNVADTSAAFVPEWMLRMAFLVASMLVFFVSYFIKFQPWDRDNIKLFYLWLAVGYGYIGDWLLYGMTCVGGRSWKRGWKVAATVLPALLVTACIFIMVFSGMLATIRETYHRYQLLSPVEIEVGKWITTSTSPDAVFLTKDTHITPSAMVAGRTQALAYSGWLWSHGYNFGERANDRQYILNNCFSASNTRATELIEKHGITHIYFDRVPAHVLQIDRANTKFLDGRLSRVLAFGDIEVYLFS